MYLTGPKKKKKNEMFFNINKCAAMITKSLNFVNYHDYEDPSFYLGMYSIPKESNDSYLGIPFQ
jgi:hypothetical protein